ncbi:MAG: prepilin-type N-terminal cleavage/methylation domain-containing protein [Deltaproteobacteria bacterium]|nr:prepilin-type N-terminal cleavage/methylation domain-containing protein [Deltaproteobacteria bacterium]
MDSRLRGNDISKMKYRFRKQHGVTIIELLMAVSLLAILGALGLWAFQPVLDSWTVGTTRSEAANDAQYALNRMVTEITQLKDNTSVITADAADFEFTDINDNAIEFSLVGTDLMRNADILARGINSLAFTYRDVNNATIATPAVSPSATDIWRVLVQIQVQVDQQTINMESETQPRNLAR